MAKSMTFEMCYACPKRDVAMFVAGLTMRGDHGSCPRRVGRVHSNVCEPLQLCNRLDKVVWRRKVLAMMVPLAF